MNTYNKLKCFCLLVFALGGRWSVVTAYSGAEGWDAKCFFVYQHMAVCQFKGALHMVHCTWVFIVSRGMNTMVWKLAGKMGMETRWSNHLKGNVGSKNSLGMNKNMKKVWKLCILRRLGKVVSLFCQDHRPSVWIPMSVCIPSAGYENRAWALLRWTKCYRAFRRQIKRHMAMYIYIYYIYVFWKRAWHCKANRPRFSGNRRNIRSTVRRHTWSGRGTKPSASRQRSSCYKYVYRYGQLKFDRRIGGVGVGKGELF